MGTADAVAAKDTAKGMAVVAVADTATGADTEVAAAVAARVTNARCDKN